MPAGDKPGEAAVTGRPDNPYDEAPAARALWQFVVARIPAEDVSEFAAVMRGYHDEVAAGTPSRFATGGTIQPAAPTDDDQIPALLSPCDTWMPLAEAMELHRATGQIIDQAQRERWTAAGRCGVCGFDGDRRGCQDCEPGPA